MARLPLAELLRPGGQAPSARCQRRGPLKKKANKTKTAQSSIVPWEDEAPAASMSFPPSQSLETSTKKKINIPTIVRVHQKAKLWRFQVRKRESKPTLTLGHQKDQDPTQINLILFQLSILG
ncbi:hypothetical protein C2845_PM09G14100 [Panicum miliaceum]|uniref:Uncharacterized protein n=1 Tax=Panicum miliaceum TaxID=4540 RepID=A0A3L6S1B1_PANMI|nr:hypothetical protein C2845_PM09G14100 [Panicum miliaceum]